MHASSLSGPILVVDDDDTQRARTLALLTEAGIRLPVVTCHGGPQAIAFLTACLHEHRALPALVFLDLSMPVIDGIGVLRWTRALPQLGELRIIVLTSSTSEVDRRLCTAYGASAYLVKHPTPGVLLATLERIGLPLATLTAPQLQSA